MTDMQFHPAANIFPLMTEADFDGLVEDIRKHGLREPIGLLHGKIIDGRNRYRACLQASVEPDYAAVETDDPVAYVLSLNLHRRHLTPSQVAMVGGRARDLYDEAAKERQKEHGHTAPGKTRNTGGNVTTSDSSKARDAVGKAVGVSGSLIDRATKVLKEGTPELIQAVDSGNMSVSRAAEVAELEPEEQAEVAKGAKMQGGRYRNVSKKQDTEEPVALGKHGVGVIKANEAINILMRIPKDDPLRKRGFQIVSDWIKKNR
jgi:ParB-like chromosome segregation protein Spo0J